MRDVLKRIHVQRSPVLNWVHALCFGAALGVTTLLEAHSIPRIVIVRIGSRCIGVCALECAEVPISTKEKHPDPRYESRSAKNKVYITNISQDSAESFEYVSSCGGGHRIWVRSVPAWRVLGIKDTRL